tara:strand:+ start:1064 stop:1477 length:414 start_codon:yes stop_codon:yes gene_type:complete
MKYTLLALLSLTLISCQSKLEKIKAQDADFESFVAASLVVDVDALEDRQKRDFHIELVGIDNYRLWDKVGIWAADSTFKIVFKGKQFVFTVTNLFNLDKDLNIDFDTVVSEDESFAKYEEDVNRFMLQVTLTPNLVK